MTRIARSLTNPPDPRDVKAWGDVLGEIEEGMRDDEHLLRGDVEEGFVRDMRYRLLCQRRVLTEKQAAWLWDIRGRV